MAGLVVDGFGGVAGDMLLGGLIDLGVAPGRIREGLATLGVPGWDLEVTQVTRRGIGCTRARFSVPAEDAHRGLPEILTRIEASALRPEAKHRAVAVFRALAEAEAKVHRIPIDHVHFHEVGAVDAILDICGIAVALDLLEVLEVLCTPLPAGTGTVLMAHGLLPANPAPASLQLLRGFELRAGDGRGEMVTPTGAAVLAGLGRPLGPGELVSYRPVAVGYGAGTRDASVLRLTLFHHEPGEPARERVVELVANLDDITGEHLGYLSEELMRGGALDVSFAPLTMKKGRPGVALTCLANPRQQRDLEALILREGATLGLRSRVVERVRVDRESHTVSTPWGPVRIKVAASRARPEHDDCAAIARAEGLPLHTVVEAAVRAWQDSR